MSTASSICGNDERKVFSDVGGVLVLKFRLIGLVPVLDGSASKTWSREVHEERSGEDDR